MIRGDFARGDKLVASVCWGCLSTPGAEVQEELQELMAGMMQSIKPAEKLEQERAEFKTKLERVRRLPSERDRLREYNLLEKQEIQNLILSVHRIRFG